MKDKKKIASTIIGVCLLLIMIIGATYAYFIAQIDSGASTNVTIEADTVDSLQFTTGGSIGIKLNQDNFASGAENQKASTTAKATLIAGTNRSPSYTYNVYLAISLNEFKYTTSDNKSEIVLRVTSPTGALTTLEALTYNESLSGFDITEASGVITLASNYEITTTTTLRQNWKVEIEVINLDSNQSENAGAAFRAEVKIQQNNIAESLADVCTNGDNLADCIKKLEADSTYNISRLLHHNETLANGANDGSIRYTGGEYKINKKYVVKNGPLNKSMIRIYCDDGEYVEIMDGDSEIPDYCNAYYFIGYDDTHYATYGEALARVMADKAVTKTNPVNNYVCFGSNASTCPTDNLYRIIGVFGDQVKLVKASPATVSLLGKTDTYFSDNQFLWNPYAYDTADNTWATSHLNKENLSNYLTNIGEEWSRMISTHTWNVGGIPSLYTDGSNARAIYDYEFGTCTSCDGPKVTADQKIGLMYASDYAYAVDPAFWDSSYSTEIYGKFIDSNWLYYSPTMEYTISISSTANQAKSKVIGTGNLESKIVYGAGGAYARPAFYLEQSIKYSSGEGTKTNPYRISI